MELAHFRGFEYREGVIDSLLLSWAVYLDLSYMSVSAIMLVLLYFDLHKHRLDKVFDNLVICIPLVQVKSVPS